MTTGSYFEILYTNPYFQNPPLVLASFSSDLLQDPSWSYIKSSKNREAREAELARLDWCDQTGFFRACWGFVLLIAHIKLDLLARQNYNLLPAHRSDTCELNAATWKSIIWLFVLPAILLWTSTLLKGESRQDETGAPASELPGSCAHTFSRIRLHHNLMDVVYFEKTGNTGGLRRGRILLFYDKVAYCCTVMVISSFCHIDFFIMSKTCFIHQISLYNSCFKLKRSVHWFVRDHQQTNYETIRFYQVLLSRVLTLGLTLGVGGSMLSAIFFVIESFTFVKEFNIFLH